MKELQQIVNEQINTMITAGVIEEMIEARLTKAVSESIDNSMRTYGDFGKVLQGKIDESLNNAISNVTLPEYNKFIGDVVSESYAKVLNDTCKKQLVELVHEQIEMPKETMTMEELLDEVARYWRGDADYYTESIDVEWSDSHGTHLVLKHPEYDWKSIKIDMYDHEADGVFTIGYLSENDTRSKKFTSVLDSTYAMGLAGYLYKLYCAKTKITNVSDVYGEDIYLGD
ncbi:hypothetical protein ACPV5U_08720 [Vibrio mediterranei]